MGLKIGICGTGAFAQSFIPLFQHHPGVEQVVLGDLDAEKRKKTAEKFGLKETCESLDALCGMDVDAIAIFTQHHVHGPQAIQALRAGKHVYSAVPAAASIEEMKGLVEAVQESGKQYMVGETSVYYPCAIYCREQFRKGAFGDIVYSEGEYYHDYKHGLISVLKHRHGEDWKHYANWPPLYYPTHSMSMSVSVTGAHAVEVTALGVEDRDPDGLFHGQDQYWNNHFSNQVMLCRMSDGSVARVNEFRRIGMGANRMSLYGTLGCYEQQAGSAVWLERDQPGLIDLTEKLTCRKLEVDPDSGMAVVPEGEDGTHQGVSSIHPVERLPKEFLGLPNGHAGSHQFLVHDFITACLEDRRPRRNHVWDAARYLIPGLVGHESSLQGGVKLTVPDFGDPE